MNIIILYLRCCRTTSKSTQATQNLFPNQNYMGPKTCIGLILLHPLIDEIIREGS